MADYARLIRPTNCGLPRCRRLSSPAEFCERGFDFAITGEAAFGRRVQAAIDAGKFFRRRLVFAIPEPSLELKREFGKLVLDIRRPCLDAFQNLGQFFGFHGWEVSRL